MPHLSFSASCKHHALHLGLMYANRENHVILAAAAREPMHRTIARFPVSKATGAHRQHSTQHCQRIGVAYTVNPGILRRHTFAKYAAAFSRISTSILNFDFHLEPHVLGSQPLRLHLLGRDRLATIRAQPAGLGKGSCLRSRPAEPLPA